MAPEAGDGDLPDGPATSRGQGQAAEGTTGDDSHLGQPGAGAAGAEDRGAGELAAGDPAAGDLGAGDLGAGGGAAGGHHAAGEVGGSTGDGEFQGSDGSTWYGQGYQVEGDGLESYAEDAYPPSVYPPADYQTGFYPPGTAGHDPTPLYRHQALGAYRDDYTPAEGGVWDEQENGYEYDDGHPAAPPQTKGNGPWPELAMVAAVAVVIAAIALGVTVASRDRTLGSGGAATTLPAPVTSTSAATTTTTTRPATSTSAPVATTVPPPGAHALNLAASPDVKAALVRSWLASNPGGVGLGSKDVAGTVPGQVYYADQPSLGTYWALAAFRPSARVAQEAATAAGQAKLSQFQGNVYVFSSHSSSSWTVLGVISTGSCPGTWVPKTVLSIWSLCGLHPTAT